jgi:MFS family permease
VLPSPARPRPGVALAVIASAVAITSFASAAPSPLYPLYQQLWGFSSLTLTVVFAAYVGAMLVSLLTTGGLSDHVGRRPVAVASLAMIALAMIVFATAEGVGALVLARILQGLATGAILGTLSAAIVDLQPSRRTGSLLTTMATAGGLGLGISLSAVLVEYGPAPRRLIFLLIALAMIISAAAVLALVPETSPRHGFASPGAVVRHLTPRMSVRREVRSAFVAGVPVLIATWSLGGLNLALGSSIATRILGIGNVAAVGALLSCFFFVATMSAPLTGGRISMSLPVSYALLAIGLGIQLAGTLQASATAYVTGLVLTGIGFSTAFSGVIASLSHGPAGERSQLFAAMYTVCYLAFSIPAVISGLAIDAYGLKNTAIGYMAFALLMVTVTAVLDLAGRRTRSAARHHALITSAARN